MFVCYKASDRPLVAPCLAALAMAGLRVWWDHELRRGNRYPEQLGWMRGSCQIAVVFDPGERLGNSQRAELAAIRQAGMPEVRVCCRGRDANDEVFPEQVPHMLPPSGGVGEAPDIDGLVTTLERELLKQWSWAWRRQGRRPDRPPAT